MTKLTAAEIRAIRKSTGLSQVKFAEVYELGFESLKKWEQDRMSPLGPINAYLVIIREHQQLVADVLQAARNSI